jgi:hypothetical protein
MGRSTFSVAEYVRSTKAFVPPTGPATDRAEQHARHTGKLDPLVDPAEYGVIRRSLLRYEERSDGLFELTIGTSVPVETRVDTTGSMGGNVDTALRVLPQAYELCSSVLPGCDLHMATGIFGDISDRFVLCRPQFEMLAEKLVEQLTLMVPERAGGDMPEDPHYGLFGGAYLTAAYINCIGLKRYDFTVSDAPARDQLSASQLKRIFGSEVFEKAAYNGHQIDENDLPSTDEVVQDLLQGAHAFFLQVGQHFETTRFWTRIFGTERVVTLPSTELLPQVQAVIIGLTEGTLELEQVGDFLAEHNVSVNAAQAIVRSVSNIPIGAQAALPNYNRRPQKGDIFREKVDVFKKTNLWPIDPHEVTDAQISVSEPDSATEQPGPTWL